MKGMRPFSRRSFLRNTLLGCGSGIALAGSGWIYGTRFETEQLRLERMEIPLSNLPSSLDGFRIAFLSDFHLYPHTQLELIERAVALTRELNPDLVALGGDYVLQTAGAIFDLAPVLARLNPKHGIFAVLGNHDHWQGDEVVVEGLEKQGIPVLRNQGLVLPVGQDSLFLAGLDDAWVRRQDLRAALDSHPGNLPTVLLMHEPDVAQEFSRDPRLNLQISGHSHGGQVRIPFWGSPFLPPLGRKYDMGRYRIENLWLYTSVGIGVTAPIRLNCPPEVTELTLVRAPAGIDS